MRLRSTSPAAMFFFSALFLLTSCVTNTPHRTLFFETIHGPLRVDDPLARKLIEHPQFQRMKGIEQHGLNTLCLGEASFTRFEHSLGVYALLKKHKASRKEQIAGLLHDVSHTAFSHVGDQFFGHEDGKSAWQDDNHDSFLKESGLADFAASYGMTLKDLDPKQAIYTRLEQDLPTLCADRINYILHGAKVLKLMTPERVKEVDDSLRFDEKRGEWYFKDLEAAKDFSEASVWMTANSWAHPSSFAATRWFVEALRLGIQKKIIGQEDFRWRTDAVVWGLLESSEDPQILSLLAKVKNPEKHYKVKMATTRPCGISEVHQKFKIRAVDPFVKLEGKEISRLSSLTKDYKEIFSHIRAERGRGYCIRCF